MVSDICSGRALVSFDFDGERVTAATARYPDGAERVVKGQAARTVYRLVCEHNAATRGRRTSTEVLEAPAFELPAEPRRVKPQVLPSHRAHLTPECAEVPPVKVESSWYSRTFGYLYRIAMGTAFEDAAAGVL
jgi:hypothetical protein